MKSSFAYSKHTIHYKSKNAIFKFSNILYKHLCNFYDANYKELIFLCIGSDRSTGDSLGPLTGYKLSKYPLHNTIVLGTLEKPVHAKNLAETISFINMEYSNPYIVAIDACLGNYERIGYLSLNEGSLRPGAGVRKALPEVGNVNITGIVNLDGFMEFTILQNTRLNVVMSMADVISSSIRLGVNKFFSEQLKNSSR